MLSTPPPMKFILPGCIIRSEQPTPLHADGEIQSETAQEIEYQILPGVLPVIVP